MEHLWCVGTKGPGCERLLLGGKGPPLFVGLFE